MTIVLMFYPMRIHWSAEWLCTPVYTLLCHWLNCELRCPGSLDACYHHEEVMRNNIIIIYGQCHVYHPLWPSHMYLRRWQYLQCTMYSGYTYVYVVYTHTQCKNTHASKWSLSVFFGFVCVHMYVVPDSMTLAWSTSSNWKPLSQRSTSQLSHKKRGTFSGRAGTSYAAAASPHTSQYPCWWGPFPGILLLTGQSCMLCWTTVKLGTRWMPLPYWHQGRYSTYVRTWMAYFMHIRISYMCIVLCWPFD